MKKLNCLLPMLLMGIIFINNLLLANINYKEGNYIKACGYSMLCGFIIGCAFIMILEKVCK